jgi:hypothetical protein
LEVLRERWRGEVISIMYQWAFQGTLRKFSSSDFCYMERHSGCTKLAIMPEKGYQKEPLRG